ncbi:hypothetical protein CONLIGDRAFT_475662 [Coniochaeta ligniaria NRRL 30616]|uniref:Uncharacterized protein n=1 Tax=Coniochaeta ligniaria NRRL 30616 TaxID=1408157 RepID=A0A1J7JBA2_9PEZI|nr:hypothetical protein CONLIGDRAFT_475662 [Coniochaeta ligniaria NRRL 30616]
MSSERAMKKTERSHEENQERAYIAASRRADRSIEARVQSARMASEIHKKRTGKGFKISEEIVIKEEMYEEEDDDLPRHYRALAAHLQTSSPDMNSRLSAYLTGQVAMASMARQKEVDKLFAESFPHAARMGQQMQQSAYYQGMQTSSPQPDPSHTIQPAVQTPPLSNFNDRSQAVHRPSSLSVTHSHSSGASYMYSPRSQKRPSVDSPPVLSPASGCTDVSSSSTSAPHSTPSQQCHTHIAPQSLSNANMGQPHFQSSFTSELPNDAKLLANINMNDPLAGAFYGMPELSATDNFDYAHFNSSEFSPAVPDDSSISKQLNAYEASSTTDYFHAMQPQSKYLDISGHGSGIGTPGGGEGDSWDNWIDENQWSGLEAEQRWMKSEQR